MIHEHDSPTAYDELAREPQLAHDVAIMRRAIQEHAEGKGRDADQVFDELRARLLLMKSRQPQGAGQ